MIGNEVDNRSVHSFSHPHVGQQVYHHERQGVAEELDLAEGDDSGGQQRHEGGSEGEHEEQIC